MKLLFINSKENKGLYLILFCVNINQQFCFDFYTYYFTAMMMSMYFYSYTFDFDTFKNDTFKSVIFRFSQK